MQKPSGSCLRSALFEVVLWRALLSLSKLPTAPAYDPTETIGSRQDAALSGMSTPIPHLDGIRTRGRVFRKNCRVPGKANRWPIEMNGAFLAAAGKDLPMTTLGPAPDGSYASLLTELKERIRVARLKAAVAVNRELILLYRSIGREILARQSSKNGARAIDQLATDLRHAPLLRRFRMNKSCNNLSLQV